MKDFSFGQHLSLPHNLRFENDTVSTIQKVAVQMQEKIDALSGIMGKGTKVIDEEEDATF